MERNHIIIIASILIVVLVSTAIFLSQTKGAEIILSEDDLIPQIPEPEPPDILKDLILNSIFAAGETGEEITGKIVFVDLENATIFFIETETQELYYTRITELSDIFLNGNLASLADFKPDMSISVRWEEVPIEKPEVII